MPETANPGRPVSPMERERTVVGGMVVVLLVLWLGFAIHREPRFPGSLIGTVLGIAAAVLMIVPSLAYTITKRLPALRRRAAARTLSRLLTWHLWAGLGGALLAVMHSGHRFDSTLGIALTASMLVVILSGYIGRHFLRTISSQLRDRQRLLDTLVTAYNALAAQIASQPTPGVVLTALGRRSRVMRHLGLTPAFAGVDPLVHRADELISSITDLEYGIRGNAMLTRRFRIWLGVHIGASLVFYALVSLHVWAAFQFAFGSWR